MGVQCSGSRFPSSVPRVSPHDRCPICVCRQGLNRETHSPPVTDIVHATKQHCITSPRCYSHLFLESPHFTMESAESIQRSLPRDAWVIPSILWIPISTYPSTEVTENVFDFRLPGRLAHLLTISRPVPLRHCTSAQSLPHDGRPHSRQEVRTDPKTEIPFSGIIVRPSFLPGHSNSGSISQNQSTDLLIPAKPKRMCSYVADPTRSLCPQKKWFLGDGYTPAKPNIASLNIWISMF